MLTTLISSEKFERYNVKKVDSLIELAEISDILSVHVPKNKETIGMINMPVLKALGKDGFFGNAARGGYATRNEVQALQQSLIAGAAVDTFDNEPADDRACRT